MRDNMGVTGTLTSVETRPLWLGEQTCFTCAQILDSRLSMSPAPPAANLAASGAGVISALPSAPGSADSSHGQVSKGHQVARATDRRVQAVWRGRLTALMTMGVQAVSCDDKMQTSLRQSTSAQQHDRFGTRRTADVRQSICLWRVHISHTTYRVQQCHIVTQTSVHATLTSLLNRGGGLECNARESTGLAVDANTP